MSGRGNNGAYDLISKSNYELFDEGVFDSPPNAFLL